MNSERRASVPMSRLKWRAVAVLATLPFVLAYGAPTFFLKIDGIPGESQESGYRDQIEVESWSWGESNSSTPVGGGGGATSKVNMQGFTFSMRVNKSSPKLFLACASGQAIKEALLSCVKAGGRRQEYLQWKFTDLRVSAFQTKSDPSANLVPLDQVSFSFAIIQVEYHQIRPDGSLDAAIKAGWDLRTNKKLNEIPVHTPVPLSQNVIEDEMVANQLVADADSDSDGLSNALERLLGTNPWVADTDTLNPHQESRGDQRYLALEIARMKDAGLLSAETSENLRDWFGGGVIEEVVEETPTYTKLHLLVPMDRAHQFLRLRVSE